MLKIHYMKQLAVAVMCVFSALCFAQTPPQPIQQIKKDLKTILASEDINGDQAQQKQYFISIT